MAKLTVRDRLLLTHPPTPTTWICRSRRASAVMCGNVNAGRMARCWVCNTAKPTRPKLVWPEYVAACKKAGIEPGTAWPVKSATEAPTKPRQRRRKGTTQ